MGERTRELNRLQKMLEGANIKLSGTVAEINGKSARAILEHIVEGKNFDERTYDTMYAKKVIAHNVKRQILLTRWRHEKLTHLKGLTVMT